MTNVQKGRQGFQTTHGMKDAPEYKVWNHMKLRCHSPTNTGFYKYGARGITVCQRWRDSFEAFFADMGPRPSPAHSLDRIDNNGPYSPENCRWADIRTQARNKRNNIWITANGETLTLRDWADKIGVSYGALQMRHRMGWSHDDIVNRPCAGKPAPLTLTFNGETKPATELAKEHGLSYAALKSRLKMGWSVEDALTRPVQKKEPRAALAEKHGISPALLKLRLDRGWTLERALTTPVGPQHGRWGSNRNGTRVHPST